MNQSCVPSHPTSMRSPGSLFDRSRWGIAALMLVLVGASGCSSSPPPPAEMDEGELVLRAITEPVESGSVHRIRMTQQGDRYAFSPSEVTVRPGDVVRFVMVGGQPESVVFDPTDLGEDQAGFITSTGLDQAILLTDPGSTLDASFRDAPPGDYPFRSVPHHESGMRGSVHVVPADP